MHLISDPFLDQARALKRARDAGAITSNDYQSMFNAIAVAAERDARICEEPGCGRTAFVVVGGVALCAICALKRRNGRC